MGWREKKSCDVKTSREYKDGEDCDDILMKWTAYLHSSAMKNHSEQNQDRVALERHKIDFIGRSCRNLSLGFFTSMLFPGYPHHTQKTPI